MRGRDTGVGSLRVIFDRSAFHDARGDALIASPLLDLCRRKVVTVFHTPVFLEETLATYRAGSSGAGWQKHLRFALDVCNGGIFLGKDEIWHNELVAGRGLFAKHLVPEHSKRPDLRPSLRETLYNVATTGDLSEEWTASESERHASRVKKGNQRRISSEMRQIVATAIKERRVAGRLSSYEFSQLRKTALLRTGRHLMTLVDARRPSRLANQWAQGPDRFPFYTAFIEGFLYNGYYAMVETNHPLDENAQPDYEQLAYLTWADLVVSNDERFFRRAFQTLWQQKGKRLETAESFVELLKRLA